MKILINTIAFIVFIAQFIFLTFSSLNQKKPESVIESVYNDFVIVASFCSLFVVVIFVIQYNFNFKMLKKKILNCILLVIVILGIYIHVKQLLSQKDIIPISCTLLVFDCYSIRKIVSNL